MNSGVLNSWPHRGLDDVFMSNRGTREPFLRDLGVVLIFALHSKLAFVLFAEISSPCSGSEN